MIRTYWLTLQQNGDGPLVDAFSGDRILIATGGALELRCAVVLDKRTLASIEGVVAATLTMRKDNAEGEILAEKTVAAEEFNPGLTFDEWKIREGHHFAFRLTAEETVWRISGRWRGAVYFSISVLHSEDGRSLLRRGQASAVNAGLDSTGGGISAPTFLTREESLAAFEQSARKDANGGYAGLGDDGKLSKKKVVGADQIDEAEKDAIRAMLETPSNDDLASAVESEAQRAQLAEQALAASKADAATVTAALSLKQNVDDDVPAGKATMASLADDVKAAMSTGLDIQGPWDPTSEVWPVDTTGDMGGYTAGVTAWLITKTHTWSTVAYPATGKVVWNGGVAGTNADWTVVAAGPTVIPDASLVEAKLAAALAKKVAQFFDTAAEDGEEAFPQVVDPMGNVAFDVTPGGRTRAALLTAFAGLFQRASFGVGNSIDDLEELVEISAAQDQAWAWFIADDDGWVIAGDRIDNVTTQRRAEVVETTDPVNPSLFLPVGSGGFSSLATPQYWAHRHMRMTPPNSMEMFELCAALGLPIELDVFVLRDGTLGVIHESNLSTATTSTGEVTDHDAQSFRLLQLKGGASYKQSLRGTAYAVTLDEVLQRFGNKVPLIIEAKHVEAVDAIVALLQRFGIAKDFVTVASFNGWTSRAADAGFRALRFANEGSGANPSWLVTGQDIGLHHSAGDSQINSFLNAGKKVNIWTVNTIWEAQRFVDLGVTSITSDDPFYISGRAHLASDPFNRQAFYHGQQLIGLSVTSTDWGFDAPNWLRVANTTTSVRGMLQGWAHPLPQTGAIALDVQFQVGHGVGAKYAAIAMTNRDQAWDNSEKEGLNGYVVTLDFDGTFTIQKIVDGEAEALASESTPSLADGQIVPIVIEVSPVGITATRGDSEDAVSTDDDDFRPLPCLQTTVVSATARFRAINIS